MNWISVKDKLPDEGQDVLVLVREIEFYGKHLDKRNIHRSVYTGWRIDDECATFYCYGRQYVSANESEQCEFEVTHWMPLPELPDCKNEVMD